MSLVFMHLCTDANAWHTSAPWAILSRALSAAVSGLEAMRPQLISSTMASDKMRHLSQRKIADTGMAQRPVAQKFPIFFWRISFAANVWIQNCFEGGASELKEGHWSPGHWSPGKMCTTTQKKTQKTIPPAVLHAVAKPLCDMTQRGPFSSIQSIRHPEREAGGYDSWLLFGEVNCRQFLAH